MDKTQKPSFDFDFVHLLEGWTKKYDILFIRISHDEDYIAFKNCTIKRIGKLDFIECVDIQTNMVCNFYNPMSVLYMPLPNYLQ